MRATRKTILALLLVLYIGPLILAPSYSHTATLAELNKDFVLASDPWLDGWDYRKAIAINGSAGAGTNYQVKVVLNWIVGMQDDYDDIRFTDNDGVTLLDYWLEYYEPDAPIIELADYGELSDESSSPDYILTNVKDGSAFNETSATDIEIWFEVDTTVAGFEGFSYAHYLDVDSGTDCDLTAYNFDTDVFVKIDEPLPSTYDWMNGTIYDPDYWNTTHIAFSLFELSGTADFYWDYGEIAHSKIARFWVNVTDNLDTDQTIYMYYGNVAASTTSNGHTTFQEFFDKDSISGWSKTDITVTTSGDYLRFYNPTEGDVGKASRSDLTVSADFQYMAQYKTVSLDTTDTMQTFLQDGSDLHRFGSSITPLYSDQTHWYYYDGASQIVGDWTEGTEYIFTMQVDEGDSSTGIDYRNYDTSWSLLDSALGKPFGKGSPTDCDGIQIGDSTGNGVLDGYFRWIAFRKCIDAEPVFDSWGEEEEPSTVAWININDAQVYFDVPFDMWGYNTSLILLGLIMIPTSSLYLAYGVKHDRSSNRVYYGLILFLVGWGLFVGGILPP